jgi:hypothetical protein
MAQMLNENDAIMTHDGRLALCIRVIAPTPRLPYPRQDQNKWTYDMFDEGHVFSMSDDDIQEELESGGRVIIMDI